MKKLICFTSIILFLFSCGIASAGVSYTFEPTRSDLWDLDHWKAYYWNIDSTVVEDGKSMMQRILDGESIESAIISFDNIYNWDSNSNELFINLFNNTKGDDAYSDTVGNVNIYSDNNSGFVDFFDYYGSYFGEHIDLHNYLDLPSSPPQDLAYSFSDPDQLAKLMSYAADGAFAVAIDPDCHYYNDGILLTVNFSDGGGSGGGNPVPEPATMILFGTGLVALGGVARKKLHKKQG